MGWHRSSEVSTVTLWAVLGLKSRIDKFYALLRKYVNATFRLLARERWSEDAIRRVNEILGGGRGPLSSVARVVS